MKKTYNLEDLDCANCAAKIEAAIRNIAGVDSVSVNFMAQKLTIETAADMDLIMAEVVKLIAKIEPDCRVVL